MRALLVLIHRWFGLAAAVFLFIAGATGAVISWDHELDEWLNPQLFEARTPGAPQSPAQLAAAIEQADPRARVSFMPLSVEPGHAFVAFVEPRVDAVSGQPHALDYNQVAVDPVTGQVQGRRLWGEVSLAPENLLPFLYKLHYSLHLPLAGGIETGIWLMGLLAIAWVLDTLIALWISFPLRKAWRRSFAFRWREGGHRLTFDLHRSGGVWLWLLVLMLAVTSVSMNLKNEVMRPLVSWFSALTPSPLERSAPLLGNGPAISRERAVAVAADEARRRGLVAPAGGVFLSSLAGVYGVGFYEPGNSHGDSGLGNPWIYVDARTGEVAGADVPGEGSAGDVFMQAMFPLHSGRILGMPGRILMSVMGVAIATLSVTGVMIWARKRKARRAQAMAVSARQARGPVVSAADPLEV